MKLSEFMNYLNSALNFPSISYNDVMVYLDMAIAELNTTLHIQILPISKQISNFIDDKFKNTKLILLEDDPNTTTGNVIPVITDPSSEIPSGTKVYYNYIESHYYVLQNGEYIICDDFLGIYFRDHVKEYWSAFRIGPNANWENSERISPDEYDLEECLAHDWLMLWLLPYVCFKYTVRDGGTAQTFAEELTQGFQQLQESYNVPENVMLATVADKYAYKDLVSKYLPNLRIGVATRAIYESMKHDRDVLPEYGSMYDRGGF